MHRLVERLGAVERGVGGRADQLAGLAALKGLRSFAGAVEATLVANLAELEKAGRSESALEAMTAAGHGSSSEAKAAGRRADTCAEHPSFHDALVDGSISTGHVDALARATSRLSDAARANLRDRASVLLDAAKAMPVDAFARECATTARECSDDDGLSDLERQRGLRSVARWVDRDSGMHITKLTLDPRTDEAMWAVINSTVRHRVAAGTPTGQSWEHIAVDTVVELVTRSNAAVNSPAPSSTPESPPAESTLFDRDEPRLAAPAGPESGSGTPPVESASTLLDPARVPELVVLCGLEALANAVAAAGVTAETAEGRPVPILELRRLACNAHILPAILDGGDVVLNLGQRQRLASPDQRLALAVMYLTCGFPGCCVPVRHTEAHHVIDFTRQLGPTDLANLLPLCSRHHHLVHEGGWRLELRADRSVRITRPDGEVHFDGTTLDRRHRPPARGGAGDGYCRARGEEMPMTSLNDRPNTALLMVDVQNDVVANAHRRDEVIANINTLVDQARASDVPVIWVQHHDDGLARDTEGWQYVPELVLAESEPLVHKRYGDSFEDTALEAELAERGIGRLIVTGAQSDACIRATLHGAFVRGYDTTLVSDAHTTEDLSEYGLPTPDKVIAHTNMYWTWQGGPGREANVVETSDVDFAASADASA